MDMGAIKQSLKQSQRFRDGLCIFIKCENKRLVGNQKCQYHIDMAKERNKENAEQCRINKSNLCSVLTCNQLKVTNTVCKKHWIKRLISAKRIDPIRWKEILEKLEKQNYICYYTDIILIPGINASIDRCDPESKGGSNELHNLVWCDRLVNIIKFDQTEKQYIQLRNIITPEIEPGPDHCVYYYARNKMFE